ncbi:MAG TPA: hypothetical protein VFK16_05410 [Gemmatimonadaceae bacterium]|jgi:hypothetical protein|nr:hypothetical protein [Gemmatimonadaceae bacterium]
MLAGVAPLRAQAGAPVRLDAGRFTVVSYPRDRTLAHSILSAAVARDSFPGLPRPRLHVLIAIAPDAETFREWVGPGAPEWGAAIAFPGQRRIVLQGSSAGADAGNPIEVVRHELAHLALHEFLGPLPPRWFDEGYASFAARELTTHDAWAANLALAVRGVPMLDDLDSYFAQDATTARAGYALATSAVQHMSALDPRNGLARVLAAWKETGSLDQALRQADGVTLAGFETDWRRAARRRFGALALMEDLTLIVVLGLLFAFPLWMARRRRDRGRMAALEAADAAEEAARRASALEELLGPWPPPGDPAGTDPGANRP